MKINTDRQNKVSGYQEVNFSDLVSGTAVKAFYLPAGAFNISAQVLPVVAFNSATSDVLDVGSQSSPQAYKAGGNIAATTAFALSGLPNEVDGGDWIYVKWTGTGAAPTEGQFRLAVDYSLLERGQFSHGPDA